MAENPYLGAGEGFSAGAQYAVKAADLNFQQQTLQMQKQRMDEMKEDHQLAVSQKMFDSYKDYASEIDPKVQAAKWNNVSKTAETLGIPIDETWKAAGQSEDYRNQLVPLFAHVSGLDEDQAKQVLPGVIKALGGSATIDSLIKSNSAFNMMAAKNQMSSQQKEQDRQNAVKIAGIKAGATVEAAGKRGQATAANIDKRFENQQVMKGQSTFDNQLKTETFLLDSVKRVNDLMRDVDAGKIVDTSQFVSTLGSEIARLETQSNTTSEGSRDRALINTGVGKLKSLVQYASGQPQGVLTDGFKQQLKGTFDALAGSYQEQFDRKSRSLYEGAKATPKMREVLKDKYDAARASYKEVFPNWSGSGLEGKKNSDSAVDTQSSYQIKSALALKQVLSKMADGPAKDKIIAQMQAKVPADVRKKAGLP